MKALSLFLLVTLLFTAGCKSVRIRNDTSKELTGLFHDDHEELMAAIKKIQVDKTSLEDLKQMGIKPGVKNLKFSEGREAATRFAQGVLGITIQVNLSTFFEDLVKFRDVMLIRLPQKNVRTTGKRFYFSDNYKEVKGHDTMVSILLNKGVVIGVEIPKDDSFDTMDTSHAFGEGLIKLFGEAAGPAMTVGKAVP